MTEQDERFAAWDIEIVTELKRWCANEPADEARLVAAGMLYDTTKLITELGLDLAQHHGVLLKELHILSLGIPVKAYTKDGQPYMLRLGSDVLVTFGGQTKLGKKYYEVYAGRQFPILTIFANSKHTFRTERWPVQRPIEPFYVHGG